MVRLAARQTPPFNKSVLWLFHYIFFTKVWDTLTTYKCVKTLEGHSGIVLALCTHEYVSCFFL